MAQTPFPVGGLILAAGAGRRMGRPKALVRPRPDGPTLLEHTIPVLRRAGIEDITKIGLKGSPTIVSKVFAPKARSQRGGTC